MNISIIVPIYKVEPYLRQCVDSILNQTYRDFELILVDDGSPDNCGAICDEYAALDPRVRVIHQENGGLSAARNAGIDWAFANSDSRWLSFIDSDDYVCDTYLEFLLHNAYKFDVSISCCNYIPFADGYVANVDSPALPEMLSTENFWKKHPSPSVVAWGKLYRKDLFSDIRYPIGRIWEDAFSTHKVLFKCENVTWLSSGLYYYRILNSSISHDVKLEHAIYRGDAYRMQAVFFHERNYITLRNTAIRRMLHHTQLAAAQAKEEGNQDVLKKAKSDLSGQLTWARKELGIALYGNESIYESVMPRRAALSRRWRHFKRDIRKFLTGR